MLENYDTAKGAGAFLLRLPRPPPRLGVGLRKPNPSSSANPSSHRLFPSSTHSLKLSGSDFRTSHASSPCLVACHVFGWLGVVVAKEGVIGSFIPFAELLSIHSPPKGFRERIIQLKDNPQNNPMTILGQSQLIVRKRNRGALSLFLTPTSFVPEHHLQLHGAEEEQLCFVVAS